MSVEELYLLKSVDTLLTAQNIRMHFEKCVQCCCSCLLRTNNKEGWKFMAALVEVPDFHMACIQTGILSTKRSIISVPARIIGSLNNHNDNDSDNIKNNWFYEQNSLACASRILVHFFNVHCTTTMWNHLVWRFMKDAVNIRQWSFLSLQDSTPGEIAYYWQIMQFQIGKVWKDTIHL